MLCPNCGKLNGINDQVCTMCGEPLKASGEKNPTSYLPDPVKTTKKQKAQAEFDKQVTEYNTLKFSKTYRGQAFGILIAISVFDILLIAFAGINSADYLDVFIFIFLAIFISRGHRWAIITAMVLWVIEKIYSLATLSPDAVSGSLWWIIIFSILVLGSLYKALKVENARKQLAAPEVLGRKD